MKKLLYILAFVFSFGSIYAQNEAIFTQYTVNPFLINPALAGFSGDHQLRMHYRSSWTGFPGAPNTYAINYNGAISNSSGIGAQILAENIANIFRYDIRGSYAYRTKVDDFKISAGFSTSFSNMRLQNRAIGNFGYDEGDPEVNFALDGSNSFEAALGFYTYYKEQTFVGLTFPSLISARLDDVEGDDLGRGGADNFILQVGQDIRIKERNFKITPSIVISRVYGAPFRVDVNVISSFLDEQFMAGLGYRAGAGNDVGLLLGTKLDILSIFYSYDINFGPFQTYNSGSHEVTIGFDFAAKNRSIDAVRFE